MALNFPASPALDDIHTDGNYKFQWDGDKWVSIGPEGFFDELRTSTGDNGVTIRDATPAFGTPAQFSVRFGSTYPLVVTTADAEFNTDVNLPAGSAAGPSLYFDDDADTGLYADVADTVNIATAGNHAITVNSTQDVGIGTTTPGAKLEVLGDSASNSIATHIKGGDGASTVGLLVDGDDETGDVLIKCRSNDTATPTDSDTKFVVHGDGLVEVNSGYVQLNGNEIGGIQVTIADDAFATVTPPRIGGNWMFVTTAGNSTYPKQNATGSAFVDFGTSPASRHETLSGELELDASGPPTGTTGNDVHLTLFYGGTAGKIYLENRLGSTYAVQITFL